MTDEQIENLRYQNIKIDQINKVKKIIDEVIENGEYEHLIISLMLLENGELLSTNNLRKYEEAYSEYMDQDHITLLSQEIIDMFEE